jgi:Uma2 family endonuclease
MLRDGPVKTGTTFAEYVEFEQASHERHEFVDGNLFVMPGGTKRHNFITNRVCTTA